MADYNVRNVRYATSDKTVCFWAGFSLLGGYQKTEAKFGVCSDQVYRTLTVHIFFFLVGTPFLTLFFSGTYNLCSLTILRTSS